MFYDIFCPNCETKLPADFVNVSTLEADCESCGHHFNFEDQLILGNEMEMPKGIDILKLRNYLEIRAVWRSNFSWSFVFFAFIWNAMMIPFVIAALSSGGILGLLPLSLHLFVGFSFLYGIIINFINYTDILVDRNSINISYAPLPLPFYPKRELPVDDIEQLYVERIVNSRTNGVANYIYRIQVLLKNNEELTLIKKLVTHEQARYAERQIELFLGIADKKS